MLHITTWHSYKRHKTIGHRRNPLKPKQHKTFITFYSFSVEVWGERDSITGNVSNREPVKTDVSYHVSPGIKLKSLDLTVSRFLLSHLTGPNFSLYKLIVSGIV